MPVTSMLHTLDFDDALAQVDAGAAFVDLRPVQAYLDVHIPGSMELLYEFGPGFAGRARDCLPLDLPLILLDLGYGDLDNAAAALRGKGFSVEGAVGDGINKWASTRGRPVSTEVIEGDRASGGIAVDVGDPGTGLCEGARQIPLERLWDHAGELKGADRVVVVAGVGVRAALAVGILERSGVTEVAFWRQNPERL
ncbi:MAG: hydroxyacylglutathione hydrolase [Actinomycetota bacterium]|jgi:rhodanese-related sulfurtransferase|nr:hydroxyacylglutathione hydrolase [Actinomycetota bacterium]